VINVDKNAAYPKVIDERKVKEELPASVELWQNKYLNNLVEQDHRFIKRLTKPGMGFHSFNTARRIVRVRGYEAMNMLRKGQVVGVKIKTVINQPEVMLCQFLYSMSILLVLSSQRCKNCIAPPTWANLLKTQNRA